jgi:hypothetical protein
VRGHHDHWQLRSARAHFVKQVETGPARHADVGDEHIGLAAAQRRERAVGVVEGARGHARLFQGAFEHPADGRIVVDDPDLKRRGVIHWYR